MASLDVKRKMDETRNYPLNEINHIDLMSEKHKKACRTLNYCEHFLIFISAVSGCVSISTFALLVGVPVGIASSAVRLKIGAITTGIKNYKSIIKKKRKKHDKILLLAKPKLDTIKVLISKALIDWYINNESISVTNMLREYNEMEEEIKVPEKAEEYAI